MKLSEKLAVLEQRKRTSERPSSPTPAGGRQKPQQAPAPRAKTAAGSSWDDTKRKVRDLVLAELAPKLAAGSPDAINDEVKTALDRILEREDVKVSPRERQKFVKEMIQDTLGYGPLEPLLDDESISEIMCNAFDEIWVERKGRLERVDVTFTDVAHYHHVIEKIVSGVGRRIDESAPMVDARLPDGSRVNAVIPPLAFHGAALTIRKFAADPLKVDDLVRFGAFTPELATVMEACVRGKLNILVSGGTGTGKTTNLNVLSSFIPEGERIITIEDAAELQLQQSHVVTLEARPANAEGAGEVKIRDLVRNALRMRPDRIIVGEVRGGEALDMLQAMNTGHEGSMTTVHSNKPRDAISRLETMVLMAGYDLPVRAIREQIVSALHLIMHLDRLSSGRRVVTSVTEVQGMEGDTILLQELFRFQPDQSPGAGPGAGSLVPTGLRPKFLDKLAEVGVSLPMTAMQVPGRGDPQLPSRRIRLASGPRSG
ncbi:MAG TPA: CpaF family protein [Acidimicrobiales bacterium]|nr:CpaF family protein [Acidimicrobiales bacterium]